MALRLLIDFGSTYTKVTAVDMDSKTIVATSKAPTTVSENIMLGLEKALEKIKQKLGIRELDVEAKVASSSAAGGLRMVAIGLVPELTVKAAKMAALGAGAKLVGSFSYKLNSFEVEEILKINPDIILLVGGTDGGNSQVILHNAGMLAESSINVPIVFAANKSVQNEILAILKNKDKDVYVTENVLPAIGKLNVEPARKLIRKIFINKIIYAKGIDKAFEYLDEIVMPTPNAVLNAAELLAKGTNSEAGLGDLLIVDVGGATTDVHSVGTGSPSRSEVVFKGLPEPFVKRTVEGDLGVRYNCRTIMKALEKVGLMEKSGMDSNMLEKTINKWSVTTATIPENENEIKLDQILAFNAVYIAVTRHAGEIQSYYTPMGMTYVQYGKDLSDFKVVIGTGGPLINSREPNKILEAALFNKNEPNSLKPKKPGLFIDAKYILYAAGLLAETHPNVALKLMKDSIRRC